VWDMAVHPEDGSVSDAEQALRAALRQALERGASTSTSGSPTRCAPRSTAGAGGATAQAAQTVKSRRPQCQKTRTWIRLRASKADFDLDPIRPVSGGTKQECRARRW